MVIEVTKEYAIVDIYRATNTDDLQGISWWTGNKEEAEELAKLRKGHILHRQIKLSSCGERIYSYGSYLWGGIGDLPEVDLNTYKYGINYDSFNIKSCIDLDFCISVNHSYLMEQSKELEKLLS